MVLAPLLIGAYPFTGLINPLWGSLFGFPLHLAASGHSVSGPHPPTELLAFLFWPLAMIAMMVWLSAKLVESRRPWTVPAVLLWIASSLFVVPFDDVVERFPNWPIYCACE